MKIYDDNGDDDDVGKMFGDTNALWNLFRISCSHVQLNVCGDVEHCDNRVERR